MLNTVKLLAGGEKLGAEVYLIGSSSRSRKVGWCSELGTANVVGAEMGAGVVRGHGCFVLFPGKQEYTAVMLMIAISAVSMPAVGAVHFQSSYILFVWLFLHSKGSDNDLLICSVGCICKETEKHTVYVLASQLLLIWSSTCHWICLLLIVSNLGQIW